MSESNGYATPDQLFSAPLTRVYTDEEVRGHKFRCRSWTALETTRWRLKNDDEPESANERLIVGSCVNANGDLIFSSDHVKKLQEMGAGFITELANACVKNAMMEVETKKNYSETTSEDSPTS